MRIKVLIMTALLVAVSNTNVFSQDMETKKTVTPQEVVENVHKAAELLKTKGKEGLEMLRDPQYELNTGDAYIFIIYVEESLVVSNPRFPERNGGNIREHLDWAGKHYGIELCDVAMRGGGWIEFVWPRRRLDRVCMAETGYNRRSTQDFVYLPSTRSSLYGMCGHLRRYHEP